METKTLSPEARREAIRKTVEREYAKGTALPAVRKLLAKTLGGAPSLYLGTADPVYYRLAGLAAPIVLPAKAKATTADGSVSASFRTALRKRRDAGVRWETLAAAAEATLGRTVSVAEAKTIYSKAGGDLDASYVGRGTRLGAPKTYADLSAAAAPVA